MPSADHSDAVDNRIDAEKNQAKGIQLIQGSPKTALIKMAIPITLGMSIEIINYFVNTIWVSGLGAQALAAVGFYYPFFLTMVALSIGLSIGGSSAVSRRIGARDKRGADLVFNHMLLLVFVLSLGLSIPLFFLIKPIFVFMGTGEITDMTVGYARISIAGTFLYVFISAANGILRGEGAAKRAMQSALLCGALNILLDPIFIYVFKLGVAGAAWATIVANLFSCGLLAYWFFIEKKTYVSVVRKGFRLSKEILHDIFKVAFPTFLQFELGSFATFFVNMIAAKIAGAAGVAVFITGWRIFSVALLPILGLGAALVVICGAAFGSRNYAKIAEAHRYALKIGLWVECALVLPVLIFSSQAAAFFMPGEQAGSPQSDLVFFIRVMCILFPLRIVGDLSSSVFQGMGKGLKALAYETGRSMILMPLFVAVLVFVLEIGLQGIWYGIAASQILCALCNYWWVSSYLKKIKQSQSMEKGDKNG